MVLKEKYQTAQFRSKSIKKLGKNKYEFNGTLTIKNISKPVKFLGDYSKVKNNHKLTGRLVFDRTDYKIQYGSGQFFENLGDKLIHDEVAINFDLVTQ